jgi:O-antigen ligase
LMAVLLSAGTAWFLPIDPFKGQTVLGRELRALVTLGIGIAFYLCAVRLPTDSRRLRLTLAALYLGGALALIWGTYQADYVMRGLNNVPQHLNDFHRLFSIRDLDRNRVAGFAFEPSWFADQLVILYLPLWFGAVLTGRSLLPWKWGPVSLELGLGGWGIWMLLMTRSRVGVLSLLLVIAVLLTLGLWRLSGWLIDRRVGGQRRRGRTRLQLLVGGVLLLLGLGGIAFAGYRLLIRGAQIDWRMRRVLRLDTELPGIKDQYPYAVPYEVANRFAMAERLVYWRASLNAFERSPLLGVGPGNAGFFFEGGVPAYGTHQSEIQIYLDPQSEPFPNPKNLWIRLLSENGVIGLAFYVTWLATGLLLALAIARGRSGLGQWLAMMALMSLVAQVVEAMSLDSYALPQLWLANGLLGAVVLGRLPRSQLMERETVA